MRRFIKPILLVASLVLVVLVGVGIWFVDQNIFLPAFFGGDGAVAEVEVPAGFSVSVFAEGLNGPRFMAVGPDGILYAADRMSDRIVALPDEDGDGRADDIRVFADNVGRPHSLVYHEGAWYVGIPSGVLRLEDSNGDGTADRRETIDGDIPSSGIHSTRTVLFLPDGRMVLSVGSSCNSCVEEDERRAAIVIYDELQADAERLLATGLRNAVGLAIQPTTGDLWATNNGRDLMGDDIPPDTLHRVTPDTDYGWPFCHGGVPDPDLGGDTPCAGVPEPELKIQAHSAPLGLTFYDARQFPEEYRGDLFMAYHGSWNRSVPTGYKVVRVPFENGEIAGDAVDFATGWLQPGEEVLGRPVDVTVGGDGALYVSDDRGGFIYRISYEP